MFCAFWLSHVPPTRLAAFWQLVEGLAEHVLTPAGRAGFVDTGPDEAAFEDELYSDAEPPPTGAPPTCAPFSPTARYPGLRRPRRPRELARLISAAEAAGASGGRQRASDVPAEMEGRYRLAVATFERLVGAQLADLEMVSILLSMDPLARAPEAIFSHSLRSYDAVMVALAEEAAARTGTRPHLATFDLDFVHVEGLDVWVQTP